jgi:ribose transport system permease protein
MALSKKLLLILSGVAICLVVLALMLPNFLTVANMMQIARQASIGAIMAIGVTLVVMAGRLDLSVGSLLSLCTVTTVIIQNQYGPGLSIPVAILIGLIAGGVNGYLVGVLRLNSLVATLGMLSILQGLALIASQGMNVPMVDQTNWFAVIGRGYFAGIPMPVLIVIGLGVVFSLLLKRTTFGRQLVAVGGNEMASAFSAINTTRIIFIAYVICGLLTSIAALVFTSRVMSARNDSGVGYELAVLAGVILGGTSILGGSGGIWRSVAGIVILAALQNLMLIMGLPYYAQWLMTWVVIIVAVWIDLAARRRSLFI